jgi:hypothetical protein
MLALTHHVVVHLAMHYSKTKTSNYAVLGDDIVIGNTAVAESYSDLIKLLGVEISFSKSIISFRFLEFAKKFMTPAGLDLSPLGPGLIISAIRDRAMLGMLFMNLANAGLINYPDFVELIMKIKGVKSPDILMIIWQCFGLNRNPIWPRDDLRKSLFWFNSVLDFKARYAT